MIKVILIVVGGFVSLILAIVIGVSVYLKTLDFNQYKDLIIQQALDATGRKLVIGGDLNVELGFSPAIAANGVSFANAPWGTRSSMAIFDRFEAQVGLIPQLLGDVAVDRILLKDADIFIERDAQGRTNFDFGAKAEKSAKKQAEQLKETIRAGADAVALPTVHRLAIENAKVTYKDAMTGKTTVIAIESMTMFAESMTAPVEFRIDGSLGKQPIDVKATLGSFTDLFAPLKPWAISAEIDAIGAITVIEGEINDPFKLRGLNVIVTIEGESMNEVSRLFGYDFQDKEYSIEVTFSGDSDKNLLLRTFYFRMLGGSRFAGNLSIDFTKERPVIKPAFPKYRRYSVRREGDSAIRIMKL